MGSIYTTKSGLPRKKNHILEMEAGPGAGEKGKINGGSSY
jgi:hypothetical protein